jgi:adenylyl-sulfate kinase
MNEHIKINLKDGKIIDSYYKDGIHVIPINTNSLTDFIIEHIIVNKIKPFTLWLTGLSGSGKSTIAKEIKAFLPQYEFILLDGDIIRKGLNSDLGFSDEDRKENLRRLIELCKLFNENNLNVITAFISPFESERMKAKNEISNCKIIYIKSSLETCEKRDTKGLYKKARTGEIQNFTGISSIYEEPQIVDLIVDTEHQFIDHSVVQIAKYIEGLK